METFLVIVLFLVLLWLNVVATQLVYRDELLERVQKIAQIVLIWLLPFIGGVTVIVMQLILNEPRRARKEVDLGDDVAMLREPLNRGQREHVVGDD
jgi:hypothetical protein